MEAVKGGADLFDHVSRFAHGQEPRRPRLSPLDEKPEVGVERLIAVGRSRSRLDEIRALDPKHVEVLALEELGDRWLEDDGLVRALRDLVPTGADAVIDYLPETPAGGQAIRSLRPGGTSVVLGGNPYGLNVPGRLVMLNCWRVIGTRFASRRDAATAAALVASGEVRMDDLITHTFPLARVNEAVELVRERRAPAWLVNVEVSPSHIGGHSA